MCTNICPHKAVRMSEDSRGFIYPQIDESICTSCNLCKKTCPVNDLKIRTSTNVRSVYAAWNKNKTIRQKSSSGGVFSAAAEYILKTDGYVVGVKWGENYEAVHFAINKQSDLYLLSGSKYVQSDTNQIYEETRRLLIEGNTVLFSGTPCQNHALRRYLNKDFENLYQIDLVCHGVPSYQIFKKFLKELGGNKKIQNIFFRTKKPYWDYSYVTIEYADGGNYETLTIKDPYFCLFNASFILRESCHICQYASAYRYGDITLADFWGYYPNNLKMRDYNRGVSLIICNSHKGERLFEQIAPYLKYEKSTFDVAKKDNKCLSMPFNLPKDVLDNFWMDYDNGMCIHELYKKYIKKTANLPKYLRLIRIYGQFRWLIQKCKYAFSHQR